MSVGKHSFIVIASALALASCGQQADRESAGASDNAAARVSSVQPTDTPRPVKAAPTTDGNVLFFRCVGTGTQTVSGANLNEPDTPITDELQFLRIDLRKKSLQFGSAARWFNFCDGDDKCKAEFDKDTIDYAAGSVDRQDSEETKFAARWVISRLDGSYSHEDGSETRKNGQLTIARKRTTKGLCSAIPEQSASG